MKSLTLIWLFIFSVPVLCSAQRDFDYKIYTTKLRIEYKDTTKAPLPLTVSRHFVKDGSMLTIHNQVNTGNSLHFIVYYAGFNQQSQSFLYNAKIIGDEKTECLIEINPAHAICVITYDDREEIFN